jgi:hypothetical protein
VNGQMVWQYRKVPFLLARLLWIRASLEWVHAAPGTFFLIEVQ